MNTDKHPILWAGPSHNALGDRRHQLILKAGPEMAVSVLGPAQRSDANYGLPDVAERGCEIRPEQFGKDKNVHFKVAALQLLPANHPIEEYHGLKIRPVGYEGAQDQEKDWTWDEIEAFVEMVAKTGAKGIRKNRVFDEAHARLLSSQACKRAVAAGTLQIKAAPGLPGNPNPHSNPSVWAWGNVAGYVAMEKLPQLAMILAWADAQNPTYYGGLAGLTAEGKLVFLNIKNQPMVDPSWAGPHGNTPLPEKYQKLPAHQILKLVGASDWVLAEAKALSATLGTALSKKSQTPPSHER